MIPRLVAALGKAECLAHDYTGWDLLEVDSNAEEILICKPCAPAWVYTRSKHAIILCGEAALVWQRNWAASRNAKTPVTRETESSNDTMVIIDDAQDVVAVNSALSFTPPSGWLQRT